MVGMICVLNPVCQVVMFRGWTWTDLAHAFTVFYFTQVNHRNMCCTVLRSGPHNPDSCVVCRFVGRCERSWESYMPLPKFACPVSGSLFAYPPLQRPGGGGSRTGERERLRTPTCRTASQFHGGCILIFPQHKHAKEVTLRFRQNAPSRV
jgi:hypothetical protein